MMHDKGIQHRSSLLARINMLAILLIASLPQAVVAEPYLPQVVLLHGLARSESSMEDMQTTLQAQGFDTCNIAYPSRHYPVATLVDDHLLPAIKQCFTSDQKLHFVTHSLGGILIRQLASKTTAIDIARVVMLSPPNQGSEAVDALHDWVLYEWINGPAGQQLGTQSDSLPNQLGPVNFELGIITGNRSINWILSTLIPGPDDGKVAVDRAKVAGMNDFLVVEHTHPLIMNSRQVQCQTVHFLRNGRFSEGDFRGRECLQQAD